jgi:amino acid adenylation domain-containing protein
MTEPQSPSPIDATAVADDVFVLPASFTQQRLWFLDQSSSGGPAYNVFAAFRLAGPLDVRALERSLQSVVDRHESLRTTFTDSDGELKQVVTPSLTIPIERLDAAARALTTDEALAAYLSAEAARPFDLQRGPLVRVQLVTLLPEAGAPDVALLFINTHHTIVDGWSMQLLLDELSESYAAALARRAPSLPDLPIQYGDYAIWQQQTASQGGAAAEGLEFWKRHLQGELGILELPRERPRPATASFRGATLPFHVPAALTRAITDFSRAEGASLFMTMLAALAVVLRRYTGQEDVLVGSPIANRLRAEVEHAIGFFANTVVLRCDVSGAPTFRQLLARVRAMALDVYAHQEVPFEQVVRAVKPGRSAGVNPLFQVMFAAQKVPDAMLTLPGLRIDSVFVDNGTAKFDLLISLMEHSQGIDGLFEFSTDLFDRAAMAQLLGHYLLLVERAIAQPDTPITHLEPLTADERQRLVRDWNATQVEWREEGALCVHDLIAAQAARTPEAVAVTSGRDRLTYRDLDQQASQLALQLVARGVGPGSLVALSVERTPRMIVALLAVLKAGGAYLPLDPEHPAARRDFILRDANVALLLADSPIAIDGTPTLRLDQPLGRAPAAAAAAAAAREAMPGTMARGSDPAYVIYTSGSTGQPKGVVVPHRAVVNFLLSVRETPGLRPTDVVLALTTLTFDIAVFELLFPLSVGAQIVLAPSSDVTDGHAIVDLITRHGVTFVQATPASWRLLLEAGWQGRPDLTLVSGGEPLTRDLADALLARGGALWNYYGPTETTVYSTASRVEPTGPIVIGRPMANQTCYILDAERQLVPPGVIGELYIGGAGVTSGYHGRPDLTEQRFVADPFSDAPGARMYRTGDLARHRPTGEIECLGRTDHQVKLRGFRIELDEIEAVLTVHPDVASAAVILREDRPGDPRLVAYVVPAHQAGSLNLETLRLHAKDRLPAYMVPSAFVGIEALPRTSSGKLDRRALPAPGAGAMETGDRVPPASDVEIALAGLWRELLGVEVTSVHDDFFALGGHSLLAMRLVSKIEAKFGRHLAAGALFEHGTIAALARLVSPPPDAAADDVPRRGEPLVLFRGTGGERPPLFLLHAVGGEVLSYAALAAVVGIDRPVYGLQADGWTEEEIKTLSLEGMAARYVQEIRTVWPNGPYHLGGFCAGAMIALEMAQQLRRAGADVALLTIFDHQPFAPEPDQSVAGRAWRFTRNVPSWLADDLSRISPTEFWGRLRSRMRALMADKEGARAADVRDQLGMWRFPTYLVPLIEGLFRAVLSYKPTSYAGRVALFRSRCAPLLGPWPTEHDYGWSRITNQPVSVEVLRGSHSTLLLPPFVSNLGSRVRASLLEVEAAGSLPVPPS